MAPGMLEYAQGVGEPGGHAPARPVFSKARIKQLQGAHGGGRDLLEFGGTTSGPEHAQQPQPEPQHHDRFHSSLHETDSSVRSASARPHGCNTNTSSNGVSAQPVRTPSKAIDHVMEDELRSESVASSIEDNGGGPRRESSSDGRPSKLRERKLAEQQRSGAPHGVPDRQPDCRQDMRREDLNARDSNEGQRHHRSRFSSTDVPTLSSVVQSSVRQQHPPNAIDHADGQGAALTKPQQSAAHHSRPASEHIGIEDGDQYAQQHRQHLNTDYKNRSANHPQPSRTETTAPKTARRAGRGLSKQQGEQFKLDVSRRPTTDPENPSHVTTTKPQANDREPATTATHPVAENLHAAKLPFHATSGSMPDRQSGPDLKDPRLSMSANDREVIRDEENFAESVDGPLSPDLDDREHHRFARPAAHEKLVDPQQMEEGQPSKRRLDDTSLDYERDVLFKKDYKELCDEPFDLDMTEEPSVFPQNIASAGLKVQLDAAVTLPVDKRQHYLSTLPMNQWEEAGQWLMEQFYDVSRKLAESRQQRREIAIVFEQEVARRSGEVDKAVDEIGEDLNEMRKQGALFMTPRKSRGGTAFEPRLQE